MQRDCINDHELCKCWDCQMGGGVYADCLGCRKEGHLCEHCCDCYKYAFDCEGCSHVHIVCEKCTRLKEKKKFICKSGYDLKEYI